MNKRTFLKAIVLGCAAPSVLLRASADAYRWKKTTSQTLYVINPDWVNAPFEINFAYVQTGGNPTKLFPVKFDRRKQSREVLDSIIFKGSQPVNGEPVRFAPEAYPIRLDLNHKPVSIYKVIHV